DTPKRAWETTLGIKTPDVACQNKHDLLLRTQSGIEDSRKTTGPTEQIAPRSIKNQAFQSKNEIFCNLTVKQYPTGVPVIIRAIVTKPSSLQSKSEITVDETKEMRGNQEVACFVTNEQNILPKKSNSYGYLSSGLRNPKATVCNLLSQRFILWSCDADL
ncbi:hypothetical protein AHF37_08042, partial [Paragonimus kellicotti]